MHPTLTDAVDAKERALPAAAARRVGADGCCILSTCSMLAAPPGLLHLENLIKSCKRPGILWAGFINMSNMRVDGMLGFQAGGADGMLNDGLPCAHTKQGLSSHVWTELYLA